jgi:hypothetical protein
VPALASAFALKDGAHSDFGKRMGDGDEATVFLSLAAADEDCAHEDVSHAVLSRCALDHGRALQACIEGVDRVLRDDVDRPPRLGEVRRTRGDLLVGHLDGPLLHQGTETLRQRVIIVLEGPHRGHLISIR